MVYLSWVLQKGTEVVCVLLQTVTFSCFQRDVAKLVMLLLGNVAKLVMLLLGNVTKLVMLLQKDAAKMVL